MKKGSLDTNALLRLTLKDIPEQHKMVRDLVSQKDASYAVNDTAVIEYVFVLERYYELKRERIAEMVKALNTIEGLEVDCAILFNALEPYVKHPKLSFEDCYLAEAAAAAHALPLWTFDKKLAKQSEHVKLID
jgi:predicted nucleic acid-binding protein